MKCPRCETATLDEKDRESVVVDVCSQCRGVWLDRGELEKLIARAARDLDELEDQQRAALRPPEPNYAPPAPASYRKRDSDPEYRYPDPRYAHDPHYKHRRKKSFIEQLGDIFD